MFHYEEKHYRHKTFLRAYCPKCQHSHNAEDDGMCFLAFRAVHEEKHIDFRQGPYLEQPERDASSVVTDQDTLADIICPHCQSSLLSEESCQECGSPVAEIIVATESRLLPFRICTKFSCQEHGLSQADQRRMRPKTPRQEMAEQDPGMRVHNFEEVPYGYTSEEALREATRCLKCKKPHCVAGCPVEIDIPAFIELIVSEEYDAAARKIRERNILPAICGRVCPQEDQCEAACILGKKQRPVAIGNLERFVADYERKMNLVSMPHVEGQRGKRIAVVGSGPAGLTVAADLTLLGYSVTVFEALHQAGGVLVYGIPEFRLPKAIVNFEIDYLRKMGCRIELNQIIGRIQTIDELLQAFEAVFLGIGAGLPRFMRVEGENLNNIVSANEYLTRINLMKAYRFPEYDTPMPRGHKVAVIGGGNVAMDCARNALRTGATDVTVVYRRSKSEMPARIEEVRHAEEEGIEFQFLTAPIRYAGDNHNRVAKMECIRMALGEPDDSGRRRPVPIKGSEFVLEKDLVVVAVGTGPNPVISQSTPDLATNTAGYIDVHPETMQTSKEFVYAGGDIVTGSATVILAMGAGRTAARAIHEKLSDN